MLLQSSAYPFDLPCFYSLALLWKLSYFRPTQPGFDSMYILCTQPNVAGGEEQRNGCSHSKFVSQPQGGPSAVCPPPLNFPVLEFSRVLTPPSYTFCFSLRPPPPSPSAHSWPVTLLPPSLGKHKQSEENFCRPSSAPAPHPTFPPVTTCAPLAPNPRPTPVLML